MFSDQSERKREIDALSRERGERDLSFQWRDWKSCLIKEEREREFL